MNRRLARTLLAATAAVALTAPAVAQQGQPPQMTPEQKAEMEAYMKAGTPGSPHQGLAASAGSYDLKVVKAGDGPGAIEDLRTDHGQTAGNRL